MKYECLHAITNQNKKIESHPNLFLKEFILQEKEFNININ
jgi:hypothetical protein